MSDHKPIMRLRSLAAVGAAYAILLLLLVVCRAL